MILQEITLHKTGKIKDFNASIGDKQFFDQLVKNKQKMCE